jgi:hypothetical protein
MKKVFVFKMIFPNGTTHYGVSEQVFTVKTYIKKCISISKGHFNEGKLSKFHKECLDNKENLKAEIVGKFDNNKSAKLFRNECIKNDKMCFNQLSSNVLAKLNYQLKPLKLPIESSKILTNKDGEKIYYVDLMFVKKKNLFNSVNLKVKHPLYSNLVLLNRDSHKVERV